MRTRGNLVAFVDGTQAPGVLATITVGLILVPEGTGSTVLWSPFTDADAPWFWYDTFLIGHEELVTDVLHVPVLNIYRSVIDSKAMRKVRNREIQCVVENTTAGGAVNANIHLNFRFLSGS